MTRKYDCCPVCGQRMFIHTACCVCGILLGRGHIDGREYRRRDRFYCHVHYERDNVESEKGSTIPLP